MNTDARGDHGLIRAIENAYGLRIRNIESCHSYYRRNSAYRVSTKRGLFLVKPFHGPVSQLHLLHDRLEKLRRAGYRQMPVWFHTKDGQIALHAQQQWMYATEWIRGERWTLQADHATALGTALAKLHATSQGLLAGREQEREWRRLKRQDDRFRSQLRKPVMARNIKSWFDAHGKACIQLANEAWQQIKEPTVAHALEEEIHHPSFIHGDVTKFNVLLAKNGVIFIDWDGMKIGSALYELVKTMANMTNFEPSQMEAFLNGYNQVHPFTAGQRKLVSALFRFPREAWIVRNRCSKRVKLPEFDVLQKTWSARQTAIRWLDTWADSD